jgi:uncharacterized protein YjiS (DUF1127 family)
MSVREFRQGPQGRFAGPLRAVEPSKPQPARARFLPRLLAVLRAAARWSSVVSWSQRRRDRQSIEAFNDRMLRDIGVSRTSVDNDSSTSFWRLR